MRYLTFIIILFTAWSASSSSVLVLTDGNETYPAGEAIQIYIDRNDEADINDMSSPAFTDKFEKSAFRRPNIGFTKSACWIKLTLQNKASKIDKWCLEVGIPWLHDIEMYLPDGSGSFTKKKV